MDSNNSPIHPTTYLYAGVFRDERVLQLLHILAQIADSTFYKLHEVSKDKVTNHALYVKRFQTGLGSLLVWKTPVRVNVANSAMEEFRELKVLYKYAIIRYLKELYKHEQSAQIPVSIPPFHDFLHSYFSALAQSTCMKNLNFFTLNPTERTHLHMEALRQALIQSTRHGFDTSLLGNYNQQRQQEPSPQAQRYQQPPVIHQNQSPQYQEPRQHQQHQQHQQHYQSPQRQHQQPQQHYQNSPRVATSTSTTSTPKYDHSDYMPSPEQNEVAPSPCDTRETQRRMEDYSRRMVQNAQKSPSPSMSPSIRPVSLLQDATQRQLQQNTSSPLPSHLGQSSFESPRKGTPLRTPQRPRRSPVPSRSLPTPPKWKPSVEDVDEPSPVGKQASSADTIFCDLDALDPPEVHTSPARSKNPRVPTPTFF
jgi:hypothetical protein